MHVALQPSPEVMLLSSHCSVCAQRIPSPHELPEPFAVQFALQEPQSSVKPSSQISVPTSCPSPHTGRHRLALAPGTHE
jgi:hypothetical protein